jgi:hypothetical protein
MFACSKGWACKLFRQQWLLGPVDKVTSDSMQHAIVRSKLLLNGLSMLLQAQHRPAVVTQHG